MNKRWHSIAFALGLWLAAPSGASAQVVEVTLELETNQIAVGQSTVLHVYAQVLPGWRTNADQIFSWYVDVLNTNGAVATGSFSAMLKSASDNHPLTSSNGFNSGANRLGIHDTFLNQPRAGVTNRIELLRFPVVGAAVGQTSFAARHGSGVTNLSEDFIVAPISGDDFLTGGSYAGASVSLTVLPAPPAAVTCLSLTHSNLAGGLHQATLRWCPAAGYDHYVEFRNALVAGSPWQIFSGGPFNAGSYVDTNAAPNRFYQIHAVPAGTPFFQPVTAISCLAITHTNLAGGLRQATLRWCPAAGYDHYVKFRNALVAGSPWQAFPGGPFNSGVYVDTNSLAVRFYQIHAVPAGTPLLP